MSPHEERDAMVELQLRSRGIRDERVLDAFRTVPRELFLDEDLAEFAYRDTALPIDEGQTISQPYIVAMTVQSLAIQPTDRVLEIGTGSGYAAAILGALAREVYTVERHRSLAERAKEKLARAGAANVHVLWGDGTLGWPEHAPYDAIAVAAGGPEIPKALLEQLAPGGRIVIPVGPDESSQVLTRVTRDEEGYHEEPLLSVRFVPLIGEQGWPAPVLAGRVRSVRALAGDPDHALRALIRESAEPLEEVEGATLQSFLDRAANARVVLLGESTHGTSEFYRMRARLTKELITRAGFQFVAVEADWPDAARIDDHVMGGMPRTDVEFTPFSRFPTWMWRNEEVGEFVEWLQAHNASPAARGRRVGFHGLDLYSLYTSIAMVLRYLDGVDPDAARAARARYGILTPWQKDPAAYGMAVLSGRYRSAEEEVGSILRTLLERRLEYARRDGNRYFDAAQNAKVVADAERYYRAMYYASPLSWNLRDTHMFETLESLLAFYGPDARGVVWEHNSHVGNGQATEMGARGEINVGYLSRSRFGERAYLVGFGTDHGTVAAASGWDEPMQRMRVRPAHAESYERLFHETALPAFRLPLKEPRRAAIREELTPPRLERAIGVVYRPESELASHYFQASLPQQFDEFVWFDETEAVTPLKTRQTAGADLPETYPFGL
jgi:protein-L-isoaspartate(D-aspartate) O-methyltransferase